MKNLAAKTDVVILEVSLLLFPIWHFQILCFGRYFIFYKPCFLNCKNQFYFVYFMENALKLKFAT